MCTERQWPATRSGLANALRRAPVAAVTTMRTAASEPRPIRPSEPVTPSPKGMRAPSRPTWPTAILTVMCTSRKPIEDTAVARCTAWATSRWRVVISSRSVASRPQATEAVRQTSERTPVVKSSAARKPPPVVAASTGMSTAEATSSAPDVPPFTRPLRDGIFSVGMERGL
ncbi:hypothetical protein A8W25_09515 [Streptomyces sp. ERV7]|nr:hypothetical protein A8W25_09515 [Streptomyces sp. ERV7]